MKAKLFLIILLLLILFPQGILAEEAELLPDLSALEDAVNELDDSFENVFSLKELWDSALKGNISFDFSSVFQGLLQILFGELNHFSFLLGQLLLLGIIGAVLNVFSDGFSGGAASKTGKYVIYLAFLLIAIKNFHFALDLGTETIQHAANFLYALLPIILSSFAFTGGTMASAIVQPSVIAVITVFMGILERFFLPLLMLMAALTICSHLTDKYSFDKFRDLIRNVILISLGFLMMIFTGVLGLSGLAAGTVDGLAAKSVKMAAGNFIPLVGGYISDAFDSILGAGMILRSSIGIFGVIAVAMIIIVPALRILIMSFLFKLAGAVLQPFSNDEFSNALSDFSSVLTLLFALVVVTGLLFFFLIICILAVSTMTMMFR
ncbi:MAG: stage III sporulation protein AE [Firmicutes bacterium]|nr:stage III sporulation protein AE [Bacillota bacterium]